ncbi:MAG: DUF362 domain-containing protein [Candidatus Thermoplasmatota archaeon]
MEVAVVKCKSYDAREVKSAIRKSLELIEGDKIIKPHSKVLLKINLLLAKEPEYGVTTHPSIVKAVAELIKEQGAIPIVGESSGGADTTENAFEICGIKKICLENNIETINFEKAEMLKIIIPAVRKALPLAKPLFEADVVISLPKLKTHTYMLYTGAVKNFFGALPGEWKNLAHKLAQEPGKFANLLLDIYLATSPKLAIMDGVLAMEGNGPSAGNLKWTNLIIASKDCLALDFVVCKLIGYNPFGVYVIREAVKRNLLALDKIEVVGERLDSLPFKKPISELSKNIFPRVNPKKCKKCWSCVEYCPVNALTKNEFPKLNVEKCIQCYCCHELCPEGAVIVR